MVYFEATHETLDKTVKQFCAPLFADGQFMHGGHDESTTNATVTFIEWRGRVYGVTCHHVLAAFFVESVATSRQLVPSNHSGRAIYQFGTFSFTGDYRWTFQSCRKFPDTAAVGKPEALAQLARQNADLPDIAIADITEHWSVLAKNRSASALNLDTWTEPDWSTTQSLWMAFGYPDRHKSREGDQIAVPMPRVTVEVTTIPTRDRPEFTLVSTLEADHGWRFSGLSGGPVFVADRTRDLCAFVGITFEGVPGSESPKESSGTILRGSDVWLRGYHVTPGIFDGWLRSLRYGVQFPRPIKGPRSTS